MSEQLALNLPATADVNPSYQGFDRLLQQIEKNILSQMALSDAVWNTVTYLFPGNCYEEIFIHYHIFHEECVPLVLSRVLGLGVTAGAIAVLVPQILKIWAAKSGVGVALASQLLNLVACTATASYSYAQNFVFSQWGDAFFMAIQTAIIILQILFYSGKSVQGLLFLVTFCLIGGAIHQGLVPLYVLTFLQAATIPMTLTSRSIQISSNYRARSTGQLSAISVFLMFAGAWARIFTSVQETGDRLVIVAFVVASIMNGLIFAQIIIYWGRAPPKEKSI